MRSIIVVLIALLCVPANLSAPEIEMPLINSRREAAVAIMVSQLNTPYGWGGNSPLQDGVVDCSGSIRFMLDELGLIAHGADYTSWQMAEMFPEVHNLREGVLVFWNRGSKIGHVEMVLGELEDGWYTIGASGGGRNTDTLEEAQEADARVKMHPIERGYTRLVDPFPQERK